ncbi:MAG: hypothetical protein CM15mP120_06030 [Pseudomonadota bacterium]|nr:MAG: hypothetical protein CM15mP120_06030 [Pseudomonadota bacterium]
MSPTPPRICSRCLTRHSTALQQSKTPIIVGGTMLYVQRFVRGIAELPSADPLCANTCSSSFNMARFTHQRLVQFDAAAAAKIHPNNHQRLLRALEVIEATGKSMSSQWQNANSGGAEQRLPIAGHRSRSSRTTRGFACTNCDSI